MMMWKCECGAEFEEPETEYEDAESYYGVSSLFDNCNLIPFSVCPDCGSTEIEEFWKEDEDDWDD